MGAQERFYLKRPISQVIICVPSSHGESDEGHESHEGHEGDEEEGSSSASCSQSHEGHEEEVIDFVNQIALQFAGKTHWDWVWLPVSPNSTMPNKFISVHNKCRASTAAL